MRIYKYKLDFYYKSLAIYLLTLVIYILIKGRFSGGTFEVVLKDPLVYLITIFIVYFVTVLIVNTVSAREIVFGESEIILRNRFGERKVELRDILAVKFSRTRKSGDGSHGAARIVKLKLANRKRLLRIRMNDFQNEKKLETEFREISRKQTQKNWKPQSGS